MTSISDQLTATHVVDNKIVDSEKFTNECEKLAVFSYFEPEYGTVTYEFEDSSYITVCQL